MTGDDLETLFLGTPYVPTRTADPRLLDLTQDGVVVAAVRLDAAGVPRVEGVGRRTAAAMRHVEAVTALLADGRTEETRRVEDFLESEQPTAVSIRKIDLASGNSYTHAVLALAAAWHGTVDDLGESGAAVAGRDILLRAARELGAIEVDLV
jgi:hypothetical protein